MYSNRFIVLQIVGLVLAASIALYYPRAVNITPLFSSEIRCPIPAYIDTLDHEKTQYFLHDTDFRQYAIKRFSRAIQVDTVIDEHMLEFSKFQNFHNYLQKEFPLVYKSAEVTIVNEFGLLFEFHGKDRDLKPVLLMAHQDTVPFGAIEEWEHHPLSGDYDDTKVFGRGTNDVKGLLVGIMGAMTEILKVDPNHQFQRSVIFAFGYDEEISGNHGAKHISAHLLEKYGPDSIDHILDEGAPMLIELNNNSFGFVVTAEKGYVDLHVGVYTPGGHSSNPKDFTAIGALSRFLSNYEKDKFEALLPDNNPMLNLFECVAEQGSFPTMSKVIAKLSRDNPLAKSILTERLLQNDLFEYTVRTSQAIDIIHGGDKNNALPLNATALINHRITIGNDLNTVLQKAIKHGKLIAEELGLGLEANSTVIIPATDNGILKIEHSDYRQVAPVTPAYDDHWFRLTSYMKTFYEKEVYPGKFNDTPYIITPTAMQGNTDTVHYWKLSKHIYRTQPGVTNLFEAHMHGTNEYVHIETHLQVIAFYYNYLLGIC